jgi:hypothetical protein
MRHARSLRFELLESKLLLSKSTVARAHTAPAAVGTPLMLDGTLAVDNSAAIETPTSDGGSSTTTPVTGRVGTLGKVHGVWNETVDAYGDVTGLDALRLRNATGTIVIEFDNQDAGTVHRATHGTVYYQESQRIGATAGGYSGSTESGSIELYLNSGRSNIDSLVLHTRAS